MPCGVLVSVDGYLIMRVEGAHVWSTQDVKHENIKQRKLFKTMIYKVMIKKLYVTTWLRISSSTSKSAHLHFMY